MGIMPMGTQGDLPTVAYPTTATRGAYGFSNYRQPVFYRDPQTVPYPIMSQPVFGNNNGTLANQPLAQTNYPNMNNT